VGSIPIVSKQSSTRLLQVVASAPERILVSFDPNVRLRVEPNIARWQYAVEKFRRYAHLIKVAEEDLANLYGPETNISALAQEWLEHRCSLLVLTRGDRGATLFSRKFGAIDIEPSPVVVADTVGAGDSFQAAMLAWLSERHRLSPIELSRLTALELRDLGRFAARAASFTCGYRGPHFPHRNALI
jgi:fructokinase